MVRWEVALPQFIFQSTPSARRATPRSGQDTSAPPISIHALREEGDLSVFQPVAGIEKISIHALREEGDTRKTTCCKA